MKPKLGPDGKPLTPPWRAIVGFPAMIVFWILGLVAPANFARAYLADSELRGAFVLLSVALAGWCAYAILGWIQDWGRLSNIIGRQK